MTTQPSYTVLALLIPLTLSLSACNEPAVESHETSTQIEEQSAPDPQSAPDTVPATETDTPKAKDTGFPWAVPDGWVHDVTPRQMRVATYKATVRDTEQEIAITLFPGRVGGELANINRWRGQMGLAPVTNETLEETIERQTYDGFDSYQTRIESDRGVMLVAAVFDNSTQQTWFVRATTPNSSVADAIESDLFAMARSITE